MELRSLENGRGRRRREMMAWFNNARALDANVL
jgi:hypothetical protein